MQWRYDDGGRATAGFKGSVGDCAVRAIAIATRQDYRLVYNALNTLSQAERRADKSSSRLGVYRLTIDKYLLANGFLWVPTNCRIHMRPIELPCGRLVVRLAQHIAAVIDGVVYDTYDCSDKGKRVVYGYYTYQYHTS